MRIKWAVPANFGKEAARTLPRSISSLPTVRNIQLALALPHAGAQGCAASDWQLRFSIGPNGCGRILGMGRGKATQAASLPIQERGYEKPQGPRTRRPAGIRRLSTAMRSLLECAAPTESDSCLWRHRETTAETEVRHQHAPLAYALVPWRIRVPSWSTSGHGTQFKARTFGRPQTGLRRA